MPSKITPKDFERFLPEERDTIAQGLLKYVQFAILFWRWYRNAYNADGTLSNIFKKSTCTTGCLGSKPVEEGKPNEGDPGTKDEDGNETPSDDAVDKNNPELKNPPSTPPNGGGGGGSDPVENCCEPTVKNHKFYFWDATDKGADLKCHKFEKVCAIRNGLRFGVDLDTGKEAFSNFNNLIGWGSSQAGNVTPSDSSNIPAYEPGGWSAGMEAGNVWQRVNILIYGQLPSHMYSADSRDGRRRRDKFVKGRVYYNGDKKWKDFYIRPEWNLFGVDVDITNLSFNPNEGLASALKQIRIHFSRLHVKDVWEPKDAKPEDYWPVLVKVGNQYVEQPYLAYIHGIRIISLPQDFTRVRHDKPIQVGPEVSPEQVVLDDRWQNERPCYKPTEEPENFPAFGPVEAQATLFTSNGHQGIDEIYPTRVPNDWPLHTN
jgi:hypothetical protein